MGEIGTNPEPPPPLTLVVVHDAAQGVGGLSDSPIRRYHGAMADYPRTKSGVANPPCL
jgi:hypothetical protein